MKENKNRYPQVVQDAINYNERCREREAKENEFKPYIKNPAFQGFAPPGPIKTIINNILVGIGSVAIVLWILAVIICVPIVLFF